MSASPARITASFVASAVFAFLLIPVSGCKEPIESSFGTCRLLLDRQEACGLVHWRDDQHEARALRYCEKYPTDFGALLACGSRSECDAFEGCLAGTRARQDRVRRWARLGELVETLRADIDGGRFDDAAAACEIVALDLDPVPEALQMCAKLPLRAVEALRGQVRLLRDLPSAELGHLDLCQALRRWAERVGDGASRDAERLCREAELAIDVHGALSAARTNLRDKVSNIPVGCTLEADALRRLDTRWSRTLLTMLETTCWNRLGGQILAESRKCTPNVRRVLAVLATRPDLASGLGDGVARARVECDR